MLESNNYLFQIGLFMIAQCLSIALIALLGAMLPGPDFIMVSKNTLLYSKKLGYFTALGIGTAILVHMTYCILGLAVIIAKSLFFFNIIKYVGAIYLIYLGWTTFSAKQSDLVFPSHSTIKKNGITEFIAFKQGFLCNLLNPKATIFFLALFTVIIKPETSLGWEVILGLVIFLVATIWFCVLTMILSHPSIKKTLEKMENYIAKLLGGLLLAFGIALIFIKQTNR